MRPKLAAVPAGAGAPVLSDPLLSEYFEGLWAGDLRVRMLSVETVGERLVRPLTGGFPTSIRQAMAEFGDGEFEIVDLRSTPIGPEVDGRAVAKEVCAVVAGTGWQGIWSYFEDPRAAGGAVADILLIEAGAADAVYRFADVSEPPAAHHTAAGPTFSA